MKYIHLDSDYRIADFACGNGMFMPFIASKVASYVGIDFSKEFIRSSNNKKELLGIKNAEFICADIDDFCENHIESFDCASALDFSEHVYDDEWINILKSMRNSLKKDGSIYIHTPNRLFFTEVFRNNLWFSSPNTGHVAVSSPDENVKLLIKAGYRIKTMLAGLSALEKENAHSHSGI